jgi:phosphoglycerate dehydrogenase-like enzyme
MKILFCGEFFPRGPEMLRTFLPDDEIRNCPTSLARELGVDADVLVPLMHRLEPQLIQDTRARLIHQWGVGLEGVDIPAASAKGIMVCNVPSDTTPNADSTAEHVVFLMLGIARRIHECFAAFHGGPWGGVLGEGLFGNRALIVGYGRIGQALARKLVGLGMEVEAIRRSPGPNEDAQAGAAKIGGPSDLLDMAARADFVVSTTVLTDETRGLFNRALFSAMKPSAAVINCSRGPVVDEPDLIEALEKGEIAGAGLDVFCREPLDPSSPLLKMSNVFCTPHVGGVTRQNVEGVGRVMAENIQRVKAGEHPLYWVNRSQSSDNIRPGMTS